MLSYKSIPFEVKEIVDVTGGGWEIAGYASTFGGEPDAYDDVIVKGAFLDSLAKRSPKHLYEHGEPIGKTLEIHEDDKGLVGRWSIVDTRAGLDAYKLAKAGVLDSMSIGYMPLDFEYREDGVRLLKKIDLYEVSSVAVPANPSAVITDVKGYGLSLDEHIARLRDATVEMKGRLAAGMAKRVGEGQSIKDARKALLTASSGTLRELADQMDALLQPSPPAERIVIGAELRRRRYYSAGVLERPAS